MNIKNINTIRENNTKSKDSNTRFTCMLNPCLHTNEKGCAVIAAYEEGTISEKELNQYRKEMRTILYQTNKIEYKKRKDKFKLGVSKNFRNIKKIEKFENSQIDEQTRLAFESEDNDNE